MLCAAPCVHPHVPRRNDMSIALDNALAKIGRHQRINLNPEEATALQHHIIEFKQREEKLNAQVEALENRIPGLEARANMGDDVVNAVGRLKADAAKWEQRYHEECQRREVDRQKLGALERECASLQKSNQSISDANMELNDRLAQMGQAAQVNSSDGSIAKARIHGVGILQQNPTNPDTIIRECAMFARRMGVTVALEIEGVAFTIKGA